MVHPKFQGLRWRNFRVCVFVGTGLSGLAPLIHGIVIFGFMQMLTRYGMAYFLGEGLLLILGALFYAVSNFILLRIPSEMTNIHVEANS